MRPVLAALALAGAVLAASCAILEEGRPETPRQRADRALADIRESRDPEIRAKAAETLGNLELPEAVDPLLRAVRDPDARVRRRAADALEHFEGAASTIIPVLAGAAGAESDGPARVDMGWTLKKLKAEPQVWAPAFRASLADPDPLTRHNAAVGLAGHAPGPEILPPLFADVGTSFGRTLTESPQSVVRKVVEQSNDRCLIPLLVDGLTTGMGRPMRHGEERPAARTSGVVVKVVGDEILICLSDGDCCSNSCVSGLCT